MAEMLPGAEAEELEDCFVEALGESVGKAVASGVEVGLCAAEREDFPEPLASGRVALETMDSEESALREGGKEMEGLGVEEGVPLPRSCVGVPGAVPKLDAVMAATEAVA